MAFNGKLIGGIIGMVLLDLAGVPWGALLGFLMGAIVGHLLVDQSRALENDETQHRTEQRERGAFIYHLLCLCARLAKADGPVNRLEIAFMEQLMRQRLKLSDQGRSDAIRVWKNAKDSSTPFNTYAQAFYRDFAQKRHRVLDMLDLLFALAAADSTRLHPAEEELLLRAAGIFHISRLQFDRIKARYFAPPAQAGPTWSALDPHYAILGAKSTDSIETIKKKYRELVLKWHPDRVQARGGSPEAIRHAQEKVRQINEAYEKIMEARGKKR
jgi:DnaJ like chaperone protein